MVEAIGEEAFGTVSAAHPTSVEGTAEEVLAIRATATMAIKAMETTRLGAMAVKVATAAEAMTVDTLEAAEASDDLKRSATFAVEQDVGQLNIRRTSNKVRTTDIASRANITFRSFPRRKSTKPSWQT